MTYCSVTHHYPRKLAFPAGSVPSHIRKSVAGFAPPPDRPNGYSVATSATAGGSRSPEGKSVAMLIKDNHDGPDYGGYRPSPNDGGPGCIIAINVVFWTLIVARLITFW